LLLVDAEDVPDLKRILSDWKDDRAAIAKELAGQARPVDTDADLDADAIIEELHHLEQYLEATESDQARAAMRRIYQTVTLYWKHGEGRYRTLERAEIETNHPFALTGSTRTRLWNERSTTGGLRCPLSRSLPAIPAARGRERNIKRTVIDRSFLIRLLCFSRSAISRADHFPAFRFGIQRRGRVAGIDDTA